MSILRSILLSFILGLLAVASLPTRKVAAACAAGTYGSASITANIPQTGNYKMWFRILPSGSNNAMKLEIDGGTCLDVSASGSTWTWVSSSSLVYNFTTSGNHTLKIVGTQQQVGVDKVILVSSTDTCVPDNTNNGTAKPGDNCLVGTPPPGGGTGGGTGSGGSSSDGSGVIVVASNGQKIHVAGTSPTTSGDVVLDQTIVTDQAKILTIAKVEYYANDKLIATLTAPPFFFDTNKLKDGTYKITEKVYFKDGTSQVKSAQITIRNKPAATAKKSSTKKVLAITAISVGLIAGGISGLLYVSPGARSWFRNIWLMKKTFIKKLFKRKSDTKPPVLHG